MRRAVSYRPTLGMGMHTHSWRGGGGSSRAVSPVCPEFLCAISPTDKGLPSSWRMCYPGSLQRDHDEGPHAGPKQCLLLLFPHPTARTRLRRGWLCLSCGRIRLSFLLEKQAPKAKAWHYKGCSRVGDDAMPWPKLAEGHRCLATAGTL